VLPTTVIGLLPGYDTIGLAAPIILTIARLIQGFSLGGEFGGCVVYLAEHAPANKRGLIGSIVYSSQCLGMLLGLIVAYLLSILLPKEDLWTFGWRIPFVSSFFVGMIGLYIRSSIKESPLYAEIKKRGLISQSPIKEIFSKHKKSIFLAVGLYINVTAPFYGATIFIQNYMSTLGYNHTESSISAGLGLVTLMLGFPVAAYVSDRVGRKPVLLITAIALMVLTYPIFYMINTGTYYVVVLSQVLLSAIVAFHMGAIPTVLVELFPTHIRFTGVALSCNLAAAVFGGTVPMIGTALHQFTGDKLAISYYLTFLAVFAIFVISFYKETYKKIIN